MVEVHSGAGGTDAQDWAEMLLRMYLPLGRAPGLRGRARRGHEGQEAGISSAEFIVKGRHAYGLLESERGVHRLVRISPFDSQGPPPDRVRLGDRWCRSSRMANRGRHRREGPAHRHVPLVGRRRPARQPHRLGGAHHPPADRHRHVVPERAQPAPEQGPRHVHPRRQAGRPRAPGARSRRSPPSPARPRRSSGAARSAATCCSPTSMVKDHRTGHETGNVDGVLDGDLDEFMEAYLRWRRVDAASS